MGSFETGLTLFASEIDGAIGTITASSSRVSLANSKKPTRTRGTEVFLRWRQAPFSITTGYLFLDATEQPLNTLTRREVPLTPEHSASFVAMWEQHGRGRLGLELYYTGEQSLSENPYRERSKSYLHVGLLGEVKLKGIKLFLNLENILNVRQTRTDPILRRSRTAMGSWTVNAWAPLEGFIANAGARIEF